MASRPSPFFVLSPREQEFWLDPLDLLKSRIGYEKNQVATLKSTPP